MPYIFRAWSAQSFGINRKDLFAPAAAKTAAKITWYTPPEEVPNLKAQLKSHLVWRRDYKDNLFVFFSTSLLFALQVALYRQASGETDIQIICIDVDTARTPRGDKVDFRTLRSMMKESELELRNRSDNSVREYADAIVRMECVVSGGNARTATLDRLIANGLYQLYPPLRETSQRSKPRLELTLRDLRKYWFQAVVPLTWDHITMAAKLASAFETSGSKEKVPTHILTYILAFQKRQSRDPELMSWLDQFSEELVLLDVDEDDDIASEAIFACGEHPELEQYRELREVTQHRYVRDNVTSKTTSITSTQKEYQAYMDFKDQERADYRAANPFQDRKRRRESYDHEQDQGPKRRRRPAERAVESVGFREQRGRRSRGKEDREASDRGSFRREIRIRGTGLWT